jgi:diamine N-acetyltransferase
MVDLKFKEIDQDNFYEIVKLSKTLTPGQQQCVANNAYSIAEGSVHSYAYYRGIYADDKPVGFFMLLVPNDDTKGTDYDAFHLWRFMIAHDEQKKHYGVRTLDHIVKLAKDMGHEEIHTSCHMGEVSPYEFYLKYGFVDTGKVDDGEQVLLLKI